MLMNFSGFNPQSYGTNQSYGRSFPQQTGGRPPNFQGAKYQPDFGYSNQFNNPRNGYGGYGSFQGNGFLPFQAKSLDSQNGSEGPPCGPPPDGQGVNFGGSQQFSPFGFGLNSFG